MRRKMLWALLLLALGAPAVWAGTVAARAACPLPFCDHCPIRK
jgi:hypothetical protein